MLAFLQYIIQFLNNRNIPYMLSGSVALSVYTLPRATRDFDFIIHLKPEDADAFVANFKEGYYCDADAVKDAIKSNSMFNIIDHASGFKADFIILKDTKYRQTELKRRKTVDFSGLPIQIVSAEDLLLSKLIWIQEVQSSLQIEDIKNLYTVDGLDWEYIYGWIKLLNLNTFNLL
ncbi:MAG: hypothetical protein H0X70_00210 [Segetibacter sp.]|nr:hypothetical protein [Segetibacter sp.]